MVAVKEIFTIQKQEILETKWSLTDYSVVLLGVTFAFPDCFLYTIHN